MPSRNEVSFQSRGAVTGFSIALRRFLSAWFWFSRSRWVAALLATGLANIDPNHPPNRAQRVRQGRNSFVYLLDRHPIRFDNRAWRYNSDNQPVSEDEFWTPQTRGRPPNDSVEHNQKFYWQKQELYFDQSTDHWRTEDGNHPAPDEFFEGEYTPGNPDEHVPEELRTPPTPVAGPSNPEPTKKETLQEHQKNLLTQISQQN
ncbi:hypothetical protein M378DRAFT_19363 [Amanita muscaria Koide BX008]|uniref:Uncharacterized protein n=1 Tax=Amanita muscaria (strain Koide BX008) TaxID=946122 RepID=A0A0C2WD38_AMAMK|nr:hypothetical protein M378DRAFT_19363 [Amanita muscaria Koide BX008]